MGGTDPAPPLPPTWIPPPPTDSSSANSVSAALGSSLYVCFLGCTAALQPEPVRLSRSANAVGKLRASPPDATQAATAAAFASKEEAFAWAKSDNRRLLHVVYRVGDVDRTIKFYTECLGMKLLRKRDIPEEKYPNAFLGYGPEDNHFVVELTYIRHRSWIRSLWHRSRQCGEDGGADKGERREGDQGARPCEGRQDGDRLRGGPRWLQWLASYC